MKNEKMRKMILGVMLAMILISGCGKKEVCDFCDEKKSCVTKEVMGEKINICDDCLKELEEELY